MRPATATAVPPRWAAAARGLAVGGEILCRELSPGQRREFDDLWDRLGLPRSNRKAAPPPPLALPLPQLPWFSACRLRRMGRRIPKRAVEAAALAAVIGYLAVRLHDDRLDEAAGSEATALLTGSALLAQHLRLVVAAAGSRGASTVMDCAAAAWSQYAEGMAVEAQACAEAAHWTESMWRTSLRRYAPMALPSIALYVRAGRAIEIPQLVSIFMMFGEAHQLFEDVVDLGEDVRGQRGGWVAQMCGLRDSPVLGERFGYIAGIGPALDRAHHALAEARAIAQDLGETELCDHLDARAAAMRLWLQRRQDALVEALLGARIALPAGGG